MNALRMQANIAGAIFVAAALWSGIAIPAAAQTTGAVTQSPDEAKPADLIGKLRSGGYIIYLRHTHTDSATKDIDLSNMKDCSKQRVLNDEGKDKAKQIGAAFTELKIPVGEVLTSEYCRARDTATLAGFEKIAETADLNNDSGEPLTTKEQSEKRKLALQEMLAKAPASGKNTLIVGHVPNIRIAAGDDFGSMKEGDFAVFAPKGAGAYDAAGIVKLADYLGLAKTASK